MSQLVLPDTGSLLVITPLSGSTALELPPYSARGLRQSLRQIGGGGVGRHIRDTVDGRAVNLTPDWMKKYESVISCTDGVTPILNDAFRGLLCTVQCACEINYYTGGTPNRTVVAGSSRVEGHVTWYRPELIMMVVDINAEWSEWKGQWNWTVELREEQAP